jgi:hypothetical protein
MYTTAQTLLVYIISACQESNAAITPSADSPTTPVLLRGINFLKTWVEHYWTDFSSNEELFNVLSQFLDNSSNQKLAQLVKNAIKRRQQNPDTMNVITDTSSFPKPILPKSRQISSSPDTKEAKGNEGGLRFLDLDPLEVARQLTIMEFTLFAAIRVYSLISQENYLTARG